MENNSRIIGIDPGSRFTGVGIIEKNNQKLKYLYSRAISTASEKTLDQKLKYIFLELNKIIEEFQPKIASIEKIFHSVNPRSSLILGHARGVAMLSASLLGLQINEYSPTEVKSAVVGVGRADKQQVAKMVRILLNINNIDKMKDDESDALAMAICQANQINYNRFIKK